MPGGFLGGQFDDIGTSSGWGAKYTLPKVNTKLPNAIPQSAAPASALPPSMAALQYPTTQPPGKPKPGAYAQPTQYITDPTTGQTILNPSYSDQLSAHANEYGTSSTYGLGEDRLGLDRDKFSASQEWLNKIFGLFSGGASAAPAGGGGPVSSGGGGGGGPVSYETSLDGTKLTPAEIASQTALKENIGRNLAAGVKDNDALMASRGITGSGIQGGALKGLVAEAIGQGAEGDREIIKNRADTAQHEHELQMGYDTQTGIANANNANAYRIAEMNAANGRLNALLGLFGQMY